MKRLIYLKRELRLTEAQIARLVGPCVPQNLILTPREAAFRIFHGIEQFEQRTRPSRVSGVRFERIAGEVITDDTISKKAILDNLRSIKEGGVFLVLGHGGEIACGAVKGKQQGVLNQTELVQELVSHVSDKVRGVEDQHKASSINAKEQAEKLLQDLEFSRIVKERKITVVYGVCNGKANYQYFEVTKDRALSQKELKEKYPKLLDLRTQFENGLKKVAQEGIDLTTQYAYALFVYASADIKGILNKFTKELDVGGICCVDSRLPPHIGAHYITRSPPNQIYASTPTLMGNGRILVSPTAAACIEYGLTNVNGIKTLEMGNEKYFISGNGVVITFATSMQRAQDMKESMLSYPNIERATLGGKSIIPLVFDGKTFLMENNAPGEEIFIEVRYEPVAPILTEPLSRFNDLMNKPA